MKPERLYTIGSSTKRRAARPVIIVPKPDSPTIIVTPAPVAPSPVNSPTPRNAWSNLWSTAKVVGPAIVAVTAILISLLAYKDQHQVNEAAATSSLRHQAALVSFMQRGQSNEAILIDNSSDNPVYNTLFTIAVAFGDGHSYTMEINLGTIPACSVGNINITNSMGYFQYDIILYVSPSSIQADKLDKYKQLTVTSMYFTDNNGRAWQYSNVGHLETITDYVPPSVGPTAIPENSKLALRPNDSLITPTFPSPSYSQAGGCS